MKAEKFLADGRTEWQTDMTNLVVAFRNFENASNRVFRDLLPPVARSLTCLSTANLSSTSEQSKVYLKVWNGIFVLFYQNGHFLLNVIK